MRNWSALETFMEDMYRRTMGFTIQIYDYVVLLLNILHFTQNEKKYASMQPRAEQSIGQIGYWCSIVGTGGG